MERKRNLGLWIVASVVVLPVAYVLSFIPLCWVLYHYELINRPRVLEVYLVYAAPFTYLKAHGPEWTKRAIEDYGRFIQRMVKR